MYQVCEILMLFEKVIDNPNTHTDNTDSLLIFNIIFHHFNFRSDFSPSFSCMYQKSVNILIIQGKNAISQTLTLWSGQMRPRGADCCP